MEELKAQLNELIEKNLPKQLGETLQKRLAELEKKEQELITVKANYDTLISSFSRLEEDLRNRKTQEQILVEIQKKQEDLELRERNLKIELLNVKLEEANKRADVSERLVTYVFKNPTYKTVEQHFGNTPVMPAMDKYGSQVYPVSHPTQTTIERKQVEDETAPQ